MLRKVVSTGKIIYSLQRTLHRQL